MKASHSIDTNLIDLEREEIRPVRIFFGEHIEKIDPIPGGSLPFAAPGFIDAHIHIESSMLVPTEFAKLAVINGTVATVSDPHEIANVLGTEGVDFMIKNAQNSSMKFFFGAPSCVPATNFETAGATLGPQEVEFLLDRPEIIYLSEMMNFPGVLNADEDVMGKIALARKKGLPIDGHAPGLRSEMAKQYFGAGISTDHECFTYEEALEKVKLGVKILIREGSAAKNFEALIPILKDWPDQVMFCSDDKHPDDLIEGHIDQLVRRAFKMGFDKWAVMRAACTNPVKHYGLDVGQLKVGDPADFILMDEWNENFTVLSTYIGGELVQSGGKHHLKDVPVSPVNQFNTDQIELDDLNIKRDKKCAKVIEVEDGQLVTSSSSIDCSKLSSEGYSLSDDVLKIVVVNRYENKSPQIALVKNFGMKKGAIASSVAHDSHNVIAVGTNDTDLRQCINTIIRHKGGIGWANNGETDIMPLEVAGLMTVHDGQYAAARYTTLTHYTKTQLGCVLSAPFMTLSFLALLVIPQLKLGDQGLFDGDQFSFTPLCHD